jgi:hypothetical protein
MYCAFVAESILLSSFPLSSGSEDKRRAEAALFETNDQDSVGENVTNSLLSYFPAI